MVHAGLRFHELLVPKAAWRRQASKKQRARPHCAPWNADRTQCHGDCFARQLSFSLPNNAQQRRRQTIAHESTSLLPQEINGTGWSPTGNPSLGVTTRSTLDTTQKRIQRVQYMQCTQKRIQRVTIHAIHTKTASTHAQHTTHI